MPAEALLARYAELAVPRTGRNNHRFGQVDLTLDDDPLGIGLEVGLGHVLGHQLGAEPLRLLAHRIHQVGAHDPAREAGVVLHVGRLLQEAAPGEALDHQRLQIRARRFNPWLYWATIVASTTCGTTLADFADRSLGIGYPGGSLLLLACVLGSLFAWHRTIGTVDVNSVTSPREETFYWITITFSQTLGTALGDWIADASLGYSGGALVFGAGLAVLAILYFTTRVSHVLLFWAAFILTRPLGATVGDFLDKPVAKGGLEWSRPLASAVLAVVIVGLILILPQRAGRHPGQVEARA